jgi:hypothetical protein
MQEFLRKRGVKKLNLYNFCSTTTHPQQVPPSPLSNDVLRCTIENRSAVDTCQNPILQLQFEYHPPSTSLTAAAALQHILRRGGAATLQNYFFLSTRTTERPNFFRFQIPFPQSRFVAPMLFSIFRFLSSFNLTLLYSSLLNHSNSRSPLVEIHHFFFSADNSLD